MRVTFDFRTVEDRDDFHTMCTAFGWSHTIRADSSAHTHRIEMAYEPETFGVRCGEAGVFAPVQITVE